MNINTGINNSNDVDEETMNVLAAHELGHILGLGDAYNVISDRWDPQSPNEDYEREWWQSAIDTSKYIFSIKGSDAKNNYIHGTTPTTYGNYTIPDTDIMRCGNEVSDFDIKLVLDALKSGELQQFPTK